MVTFLKETESFQTRRSEIKTALTFAGRCSDSCFSAVHFFFPSHCWLSLTIIVARKILAFFTLNPAFEWQVGYNGMRPNLSIPHGRNVITQFSIPQVLNLAVYGIVRPALVGVGTRGGICKEIIKK